MTMNDSDRTEEWAAQQERNYGGSANPEAIEAAIESAKARGEECARCRRLPDACTCEPELEQATLFDAPPAWKEHWDDSMPEFEMENVKPHGQATVYFANAADQRAFFVDLLGYQRVPNQGIWYPHRAIPKYETERNVDLPVGRYPIYVISKGRADTRLTSKALERLGLPYRIVIEPQERDEYAAVI